MILTFIFDNNDLSRRKAVQRSATGEDAVEILVGTSDSEPGVWMKQKIVTGRDGLS